MNNRMSKRENARRILTFDHPEWVMTGLPEYSIAYYGANHESWDGGGDDRPVGSRWSDIWGVGWHKEQPQVMGLPVWNPLAEPAALADYRWPDPNDERLIEQVYRRTEAPHDPDTFLTGSHRDTLWEKAYMLVGMENLMTYFYTEPAFVREVLHGIMDFQLGIARHYLRAGVELVGCSDDLGTQTSLLLSPATIREFLVPEYRRLFSLYKENGVLINFHSCGHVEPLIDLFIELGIDCLNPVQATANSLQTIVDKADGRLALMGGISSGLLMEGPDSRIREAVREAIRIAGRRGGYFCTPDQGMPYPPAQLEAYWQAVEDYGRYPAPEG